ncbi:unnamed protein product, partial [Arctogadus glacialis]
MGETREEIVAMIKGFPGGVPGRKVAEQYNRTYHKNLTVASLGFKSMALLLTSLDKELVVQGSWCSHRSHWPPGVADTRSRPGTGPEQLPERRARGLQCRPWGTASRRRPGRRRGIDRGGEHPRPPLLASRWRRARRDAVPDQLLQRITQVMKEDKLAGGSMARLAECYSERFGEALPLEQYMTLYDTWDSRRPGKPSGASAEAAEPRRPVPTQHTEAPTTLPVLQLHARRHHAHQLLVLRPQARRPHAHQLLVLRPQAHQLPVLRLRARRHHAHQLPVRARARRHQPTNSLFSSSVPAGPMPTNSVLQLVPAGPMPTNSLFSSSVPAGTPRQPSLFSSSVPGPMPTGTMRTMPTLLVLRPPGPPAHARCLTALEGGPPVAFGSLAIKPPPAGPSDEDFPALGAAVAREPRRPPRPGRARRRPGENSPSSGRLPGSRRHVHAANRARGGPRRRQRGRKGRRGTACWTRRRSTACGAKVCMLMQVPSLGQWASFKLAHTGCEGAAVPSGRSTCSL